MLFEVKNSGKGHFNDVSAEVEALTPNEQNVDTVRVNQTVVWERYPFNMEITTNANATDIVMSSDGVIRVEDITGGSEISLGDLTTIPGEAGVKKYRIQSGPDTKQFKFTAGELTEANVILMPFIEDISYLFADMPTLTNFIWSYIPPSNITTISHAFENTNVSEITKGNVPFLIDISYAWAGTQISDLTELNTTNVTNFAGAFKGCPIEIMSLLDVANGTAFDSMFENCTLVEELPVFIFTNGVTFTNMFKGCSAITYVPLLDFPEAINVSGIFMNCISLTYVDLGGNNYGGFDAPKLITAADIFNGCTNLTSILGNTVGWIFYSLTVEDYSRAYKDTPSYTNAHSAHLNVSSLKYAEEMFINGNINYSSPANYPELIIGDRMFKNTTVGMNREDRLNLPKLETGIEMFADNQIDAGVVSATPIEGINAPLCLDMTGMFRGLKMSTFPVPIAMNASVILEETFKDCTEITLFPALPVSGTTNFKNTWNGCTSMIKNQTEVISAGTEFDGMLSGCAALTCMTKIDTTNQTSTTDMFNGCVSLTQPDAAEQTNLLAGSSWINAGSC